MRWKNSKLLSTPLTPRVPPLVHPGKSTPIHPIIEAGDSLDSNSGVTTQRSSKNRLLPWDDEAATDSPVRRVQQVTRRVAAPAGRNLPGMPLSMPDPEDDDEFARTGRQRFDEPQRVPWWRPATHWGRIFLGCGVLTVTGVASPPASCSKPISSATRVFASPAPATSRPPASAKSRAAIFCPSSAKTSAAISSSCL